MLRSVLGNGRTRDWVAAMAATLLASGLCACDSTVGLLAGGARLTSATDGGGAAIATRPTPEGAATRQTLLSLAATPADGGAFADDGDGGTFGAEDGGGIATCAGDSLDLWDYLLPSCDGPSGSSSPHGRQVWPAASSDGWGHFYFTKDAAGAGFEHWSVNRLWFRIHRDTTWAFDAGDRWCDVQCRTDNQPGNCAQRWAGDSADYAFTVYRARDDAEGAQWYPRCVHDGDVFTTYFRSSSAHLAGCGACSTNFDGDTEHTVRFTRLATWEGYPDVLRTEILGGSGSGESYFYSRGVGWIGFGGGLLPTDSGGTTAPPADPCGRYSPGNICAYR